MLKFKFLSENKTDYPKCLAEHGLSIYIETPQMKILFDAGASPHVFVENAKRMGVDLTGVDACVISHGHYDHTEGVPTFCELNTAAKVYVHQDAFNETYGLDKDERFEQDPCSILWSEDQKRVLRDRLFFTKGFLKLTEDIVISGSIPDMEDYTVTDRFFVKDNAGNYEEDPMLHEQFLAIRNRDEEGGSTGIYIFSGCCHKGVIPTIRYARELFPQERIAGFIAGMHLMRSSEETRKNILDEMLLEGVEMLMPVHCTGINAICELKAAMGRDCILATAGSSYIF